MSPLLNVRFILAFVIVAAAVSLGACLPGPAAAIIGPEPTPRAFAMGLTLLAIGCLAREKPLLRRSSSGTR